MSFKEEYKSAVAGIKKFTKLLTEYEENQKFKEEVLEEGVKDEYKKIKDKIKKAYKLYKTKEEKNIEYGWVIIGEETIKIMYKNNYDKNKILIMEKIKEIIIDKHTNKKDKGNDIKDQYISEKTEDNYGDIKVKVT